VRAPLLAVLLIFGGLLSMPCRTNEPLEPLLAGLGPGLFELGLGAPCLIAYKLEEAGAAA